MNLHKFLVLSALTSLGLIACSSPPVDLDSSDEGNDTMGQDGDFVRLDIEVVGDGQLAVLEPYVESCTTEDGVCSFVFERSTRVVFEAETVLALDHEVIVDCSGRSICALDLDASLTILANFEAQGPRIEGKRSYGFLPGAPWIIIDPFTADPDRGTRAPRLESMIEE